MNKLAVIACLLGTVLCAPRWDQLENYTFEQYLGDFKKEYGRDTEEFFARKAIFERKLEEIKAHNRDLSQTYKKGINRYSDQSSKEVKAVSRGYDKSMTYAKTKTPRYLAGSETPDITPEQLAALPVQVDWRGASKVSPVKDQGHCGSCWAFASTATIESHAAINSGQLKTLSTQQLVSCVSNPFSCGGQGGCGGAIAELAFGYVQLYGLTSEYKYAYTSYFTGDSGQCAYNQYKQTPEVAVDGFVKLPANSYAHLLNTVATVGPVAVSVDASHWHDYESGVFNGCSYDSNLDVDHAVVVEGYGTDEQYGDYWLVRNSWGTHYGELGYIRLKREAEPKCGVDTTPFDGTACAGQNATVTVCGQCAVLSDSSYPLNARVIG